MKKPLSRVDRIGKPLGLNRSEIVRQALREWLHRHAVQSFEQEWIAALQKKPDENSRAEDWMGFRPGVGNESGRCLAVGSGRAGRRGTRGLTPRPPAAVWFLPRSGSTPSGDLSVSP